MRRVELIVGSFILLGVYSFDEIFELNFINQFIDSVFVMPSDLGIIISLSISQESSIWWEIYFWGSRHSMFEMIASCVVCVCNGWRPWARSCSSN